MKKTKHRIIRYTRVYTNKIRKLNRKSISRWFNQNLKTHPFILGILIFIWISGIIGSLFENRTPPGLVKFLLKFHGWLFLAWLVLVILSDLLKDKERVKWFLKKRFVFTLLVILTPLGLILLWSGSRFKRATKITLTVIFALLFITSQVYNQKKAFRLMEMTTFERVVEMIAKEKVKIYLKPLTVEAYKGLIFTRLPQRGKPKLAVSEIYKRNAASIASIVTKNKAGQEIGRGSGFVISPNGVIATNAHVLNGAYQAEVDLGKDKFSEAQLLKNIPEYDIALLKINAQGLPAVSVGDSDRLSSGQFVIALGNPLGLEQSVSTGIISALRSGKRLSLIQITTPLSPGSSGGPLLNEYGEVIGITTLASFFMAQNVNFAIPINYLTQAAEKEK